MQWLKHTPAYENVTQPEPRRPLRKAGHSKEGLVGALVCLAVGFGLPKSWCPSRVLFGCFYRVHIEVEVPPLEGNSILVCLAGVNLILHHCVHQVETNQ